MKSKDDISNLKVNSLLDEVGFELAPESKERLIADIESALKLDIKSKKKIKDLLKTKDTFDNSLGNIYNFISDVQICASCPHQLKKCPKKQKGFYYNPEYDKSRDLIVLTNQPCQLKAKKDEILQNIYPSDCGSENIYIDGTSLYERLVGIEGFTDTYKDLTSCISNVFNDVESFDKTKIMKGRAFFSLNSSSLSYSLLELTAYLYAQASYKCSFVDLPKLFMSVDSKNYDTREFYQANYNYILNVPVLIGANFDNLPHYGSEFNTKYIFHFLKKRLEKGKITYFSLTTSQSLFSYVSYLFSHCDVKAEAVDTIGKLVERLTIRDLPL